MIGKLIAGLLGGILAGAFAVPAIGMVVKVPNRLITGYLRRFDRGI